MPVELSDIQLTLLLGEDRKEIPVYDVQKVGSGVLNAFIPSKEGEVRLSYFYYGINIYSMRHLSRLASISETIWRLEKSSASQLSLTEER